MHSHQLAGGLSRRIRKRAGVPRGRVSLVMSGAEMMYLWVSSGNFQEVFTFTQQQVDPEETLEDVTRAPHIFR